MAELLIKIVVLVEISLAQFAELIVAPPLEHIK